MIVTLTLNPCVDRTCLPDGSHAEQSGGKGINVARVLGALGEPCLAVAPVGTGPTGERLLALARNEGVRLLPVAVSADTRRIDTRFNPATLERGALYVRGQDAFPDEAGALLRALVGALPGARLLMVCGSAPGPVLAKVAGEALSAARERGVPTLLDSNGEALSQGCAAGPDMLKINRSECMQLLGRDIPPEREAEAAEALLGERTRGAIVTLGGRGAIWARAGAGTLFCPAPKGPEVNPVGSGDCFAAALVWALLRGFGDPGALAVACAAGAANARVFPAARISRRDIEEILGFALGEEPPQGAPGDGKA